MNKQELIEVVNGKMKNPLSKADAERFVNGIIETIKETVAKGEPVQLIGFGTFERRERSAKTARNPQTGAALAIPAKKVPGFKAGKAFKDTVNA